MGSHLSKIKSLTLDNWNESQIDRLRTVGTKNANKKWNPKRVPFPFDEDDKSAVEMWFKDKYVLKKFSNGDIEDESEEEEYPDRYRLSPREDRRDRRYEEETKKTSRFLFRRNHRSNSFFEDSDDDKDNSDDKLFKDDIYSSKADDSRDYYDSQERSKTGRFKISGRFLKFTSARNKKGQDFDSSLLPTTTGRAITQFEDEVYKKEAVRFSKKTGIKNLDSIIEALVLARGDNFVAFEIIKKSRKAEKAKRNRNSSPTEEKKPALPKRTTVDKPVKESGNWFDDDNVAGTTTSEPVLKPVADLFDADDDEPNAFSSLAGSFTPGNQVVLASMTGNPFGVQNTGNPFGQQITGNPFMQPGAQFQQFNQQQVAQQPLPQLPQQTQNTGNPFLTSQATDQSNLSLNQLQQLKLQQTFQNPQNQFQNQQNQFQNPQQTFQNQQNQFQQNQFQAQPGTQLGQNQFQQNQFQQNQFQQPQQPQQPQQAPNLYQSTGFFQM